MSISPATQEHYTLLETPLHAIGAVIVADWRDDGRGGLDKTLRKIAAGAALAILAIGGLIDTIASLALCILTAPAALAGNSLSRGFLRRAVNGGLFSFLALTFLQYNNIVKNKLMQKETPNEK